MKRVPKTETITLDEWMAELGQAMRGGDAGGATVEELTVATGRSQSWVRGKLRGLMRQGRLRLGRKAIQALNGRWVESTTYLLAKEGL